MDTSKDRLLLCYLFPSYKIAAKFKRSNQNLNVNCLTLICEVSNLRCLWATLFNNPQTTSLKIINCCRENGTDKLSPQAFQT